MNPMSRALALAGAQRVQPKGKSKRQVQREYAMAQRQMDAPDELRKVAGCPKCPSWFPSIEARNEHRALEHG